jgi:hypothetical protein
MTEQNTGNAEDLNKGQNTSEETDNQTDNQNTDEKTDNQNDNQDNQGEGTQGQEDQGDKGQDDPKEHNRQGYEIRKKKEVEQVKQEEFEEYKQKVEAMEAENEKLKFQQAHPEITDDLYQTLEAQAKGSDQTKEDILNNNPLWKGYLETAQATQRVEGAEPSPSARTGTATSNKSAWDMDEDEFKQKMNEVKSRM